MRAIGPAIETVAKEAGKAILACTVVMLLMTLLAFRIGILEFRMMADGDHLYVNRLIMGGEK